MDYYWELIQQDGTRIEIPPEHIEIVKRRWNNGEPIHMNMQSIPANQIKTLYRTDKPYTATPLLEAVAHAFNEPVITEAGDIQARWVKKTVPSRMHAKKYNTPAYKVLEEGGGVVTVAYRVPVHLIDTNSMQYCEVDEINRLTRMH